MRILLLSTLYPPDLVGGAEKSVSLIAQGLAARGHEVIVLSLHKHSEVSKTIEDGVLVLRYPLRNIYWPFPAKDGRGPMAKAIFHVVDTLNPLMASIVERVVRQYTPDIVLSNQMSCFSTLSWKVISQQGVPILHSLRDYYLLCPRSTMFRLGRRCDKQCIDCTVMALPRKRMTAYVNGLTAVSQHMIEQHRRYGLFKYALALPPILSAVPVPKRVSARLSSPPDGVCRFGYIGRLAPEKGIENVLDSLLRLPKNRWQFLIAGTGPDSYIDHLRQRAANAAVQFLGHVQSHILYNAVDVVVVPSLWDEPLPRAALEAFAYGLPVIATTRGGIPEVVRADETGYLVNPESLDHMSRVIESVISNRERSRTLGAAGRRLVASRTKAVVAADYEQASLAVLDQARDMKKVRVG